MKFSHIEFLGTDKEVLDFTGASAFDYVTDYTNASLNVHLFGSHGKCNVPIGYHLVKDSDGALSVLTDEVSSYFDGLEKENAELKKRNAELAGQKASLERWLGEAKVIIKDLLFHLNKDTFVIISETQKESIERAEQFLKE